MSLAPDSANTADGGTPIRVCPDVKFRAHPLGRRSLPLHLACFNAKCPVYVIKLLLEKSPVAIAYQWEDVENSAYRHWTPEQNGLPLHCYIKRALKHGAIYNDEGWVEIPEFPTGKLDYDTVNMLIEAYPEALLDVSIRSGAPIHILCQGFDATLELHSY